MSDFDRMIQYVKELEQENKMLINQNAQLKEELRKLKLNSEALDNGLDKSRLVRQLSGYIELIKLSKPWSSHTSQRPAPASPINLDQLICRKDENDILKNGK